MHEARDVIRSFEGLSEFLPSLGVRECENEEVAQAVAKKGLKVPRRYLIELIDTIENDLQRRQIRKFIVPEVDSNIASLTQDTTTFLDGHSVDSNPCKGLTRMYPDRVLLSPTHACMVHCPWCFRDMGVGALTEKQLQDVLDYIQRDPRITDVIITGGEPLLTSDRHLDFILSTLRKVEHVDIIRFHTRMPIVVPSRINDDMIEVLNRHKRKGKPILFVTQYIHPNELTERSTDAIYRLASNGIQIFNQAPVLREVNDDQPTFNRWMKTMIKYQVKPYYAITTIIKDGLNSRFFVPFEEVSDLVNEYSSHFDGMGRPTIIMPVMGRKQSPTQLKQNMNKKGAYVRNTKSEIWKGTK